MSDEASGSHPSAPRPGAQIGHVEARGGGIVVDWRTVAVVVALVLGGGGTVGSVTGIIGGSDAASIKIAVSEAVAPVQSKLNDIDKRMAALESQASTLADHETRLRRLEEKARLR